MPNYWLAMADLSPVIIVNTRTKIAVETGLEIQPWVVPFSDTEKQIKSAPDDINQYASTIWLYNNEPQLALDDSHLDFAIIPTPNPWWLKILIHQPLPNNFTISGIQGQLWSETVRSDEQAEYMIYPRLLALAERAWHQASWQVPYNANGGQYSKGSNVFNQQLRQVRDKQWLAFS